jgi:hypothetical protein
MTREPVVVPDKSDPRWRELVAGTHKFQLESLAARMLVTRLRLRTLRGDSESIDAAITAAWEFFSRNELTTQADVRTLFGESP